jgi:putative serine/threonine protein kinase
LQNSVIVPTADLGEEPYASVLSYPKVNVGECQNRLRELQNLGVDAVEFSGEGRAFNLPVLGKGYVGIVVIAHVTGRRCALKIRRIDAGRVGMQYEAQMLLRANAVDVGPKLIDVSKNFLLMQLIEGSLLPGWLEILKDKYSLREVLSGILEQCWRLDVIGLDHGELSKAPKHLIIDPGRKPWIVDFETASIRRKPANITAICQYLFVGCGHVARVISELLGDRNADNIVDVLRLYKNAKTRENFDQVLQSCLY